MGMCRVPSHLLAVALLLVGECSGGLGPAAEAAAHGDFAAPAQHGALPPQVQAMVAQLVEAVEVLRTEVLELKADRGRSQERAAVLRGVGMLCGRLRPRLRLRFLPGVFPKDFHHFV